MKMLALFLISGLFLTGCYIDVSVKDIREAEERYVREHPEEFEFCYEIQKQYPQYFQKKEQKTTLTQTPKATPRITPTPYIMRKQ